MKFYLTGLFCSVVIFIFKSEAMSAYWTRVLPRICSANTPQNINKALLDCDKLMDNEVKTIFNNCVKQVNGYDVNEEKPKICYYSQKAQQLDNCKSSRYRERNYNLSQIINKEHKHTWCIMKIARPLGWEHLCVSNLSQQKKLAIHKCEDVFKDITSPISKCYVQLSHRTDDGRPAACHTFEYSNELWNCMESNGPKDPNKSHQLEEKTNRYMDCLKAVDPKYR